MGDEPRRIGPGELPAEIVLTTTEAFDVAEALEEGLSAHGPRLQAEADRRRARFRR